MCHSCSHTRCCNLADSPVPFSCSGSARSASWGPRGRLRGSEQHGQAGEGLFLCSGLCCVPWDRKQRCLGLRVRKILCDVSLLSGPPPSKHWGLTPSPKTRVLAPSLMPPRFLAVPATTPGATLQVTNGPNRIHRGKQVYRVWSRC